MLCDVGPVPDMPTWLTDQHIAFESQEPRTNQHASIQLIDSSNMTCTQYGTSVKANNDRMPSAKAKKYRMTATAGNYNPHMINCNYEPHVVTLCLRVSRSCCDMPLNALLSS